MTHPTRWARCSSTSWPPSQGSSSTSSGPGLGKAWPSQSQRQAQEAASPSSTGSSAQSHGTAVAIRPLPISPRSSAYPEQPSTAHSAGMRKSRKARTTNDRAPAHPCPDTTNQPSRPSLHQPQNSIEAPATDRDPPASRFAEPSGVCQRPGSAVLAQSFKPVAVADAVCTYRNTGVTVTTGRWSCRRPPARRPRSRSTHASLSSRGHRSPGCRRGRRH